MRREVNRATYTSRVNPSERDRTFVKITVPNDFLKHLIESWILCSNYVYEARYTLTRNMVLFSAVHCLVISGLGIALRIQIPLYSQ